MFIAENRQSSFTSNTKKLPQHVQNYGNRSSGSLWRWVVSNLNCLKPGTELL